MPALFRCSAGVPFSGVPGLLRCSVDVSLFRRCFVVPRVLRVPVLRWCSVVPALFRCFTGVPCSGVPDFIVFLKKWFVP